MRLSIFLTALKLLQNMAASGKGWCKYESVSRFLTAFQIVGSFRQEQVRCEYETVSRLETAPELFQNQAVSGKNRCKYKTVSRFLFSYKSQAVSGKSRCKCKTTSRILTASKNFGSFRQKQVQMIFFLLFHKK